MSEAFGLKVGFECDYCSSGGVDVAQIMVKGSKNYAFVCKACLEELQGLLPKSSPVRSEIERNAFRDGALFAVQEIRRQGCTDEDVLRLLELEVKFSETCEGGE